MNRFKLCLVIAAVALTTGAGGFSLGSFTIQRDLNTLRTIEPQGTPFTRALTKEYRDIAVFEADEMYDWPDASHFTAKGLSAARGNVEQPESLANWNIPKDKVSEMTDARARLVTALDANGRTGKPEVAARAQGKFDCWVEQQEENWQLDHIAACREGFFTALRELEARPVAQPAPPPAAPAPAPAPAARAQRSFLVFFDWDKADIRPDARSIIEQAVRAIRAAGQTPVTATGHADRSGPDTYNVGLSQRRANNVRAEMQRLGVASSQVNTVAKGEAEPLVQTPDGVREPQNRRVEIAY